jgi:hypothetical protein
MGNTSGTNFSTINNNLDTKSITLGCLNTHCIVCGSPFQTARVGKLYCSGRCKQFGYNHKAKINGFIEARNKGISRQTVILFMDDYINYDRRQKSLRRYRDLDKKKKHWESLNQEIIYRQKLDIPISNYQWDTYAGKKLSENEEGDLYNAETELDERILDLNAKELTLEQWSFIKSLYPSLDELSFFEMVCSLSKEFLSQLTLTDTSNNSNVEYLVIKNKFINHCNLIAMGIVKFEIKEAAVAL